MVRQLLSSRSIAPSEPFLRPPFLALFARLCLSHFFFVFPLCSKICFVRHQSEPELSESVLKQGTASYT